MGRWIVAVCFLAAAAAIAALATARLDSGGPPACSARTFEDSRFTVCVFDPQRHSLRLLWTADDGRPLRRLTALRAALGEDASRVLFAMNAGMFDSGGAPLGLYVERGVERRGLNLSEGDGNFYLKPNGVFSVDADGSVHLESSDSYLARASLPEWATQSGPLLVQDGALHASISMDGSSRYVRNAVGLCADGQVRFIISDDVVSFGRLARLYRDALDCPNALYLDGAVSSLWSPATRRMDNGFDLGPVVVVSARY